MDQAINIARIYSLQMNFLPGLKQSYMTLSQKKKKKNVYIYDSFCNTCKYENVQKSKIDATI